MSSFFLSPVCLSSVYLSSFYLSPFSSFYLASSSCHLSTCRPSTYHMFTCHPSTCHPFSCNCYHCCQNACHHHVQDGCHCGGCRQVRPRQVCCKSAMIMVIFQDLVDLSKEREVVFIFESSIRFALRSLFTRPILPNGPSL